MRRKHLVAVTAAVAVLAYGAILAGAPVAVTAVLGLALFASLGWVWGAVLLGPRLGELEGIVVAAALALALPILGGLVLQAARIPLHARAWGGLVAGLTLTGDVLVLLRSRGGRGEDTGARPARWSPSAWQATVFGAALVVAAGAVGVARVGASIQRYPGFTELSMPGVRHNPAAADLGVVNHQGHSERYRLVLLHQGRPTVHSLEHRAAQWPGVAPHHRDQHQVRHLGQPVPSPGPAASLPPGLHRPCPGPGQARGHRQGQSQGEDQG